MRRGRGYGIPQWDYQVTGRLTLRLDHYLAKRSNYSDGVRQRLDDRLDDLLDEVGRIFEAEERRDIERERQQREQAKQRVLAVEAAYQDLIEDRRRAAVTTQVGQWRLAHDLRRYSDEVRLLLPQMAPQVHQKAQEWLAWVESYLGEELEPLVAAPALPPDPQRRDTSIAPLIAGHGGNQAWMDWIAAGG